MVREVEMRVESSPQYVGPVFHRQQGAVQANVRIDGRLLTFRNEKGDGDLGADKPIHMSYHT